MDLRGQVMAERFKLCDRIGAGSFGEIYICEDLEDHQRYAVKLESVNTKVPQLKFEAKLYKLFLGFSSIGQLHWYGRFNKHHALVFDYLGKSLEYYKKIYQRLSLKTVLMLADQMLTCIEYFHRKCFIHRDIKPDNFVMGLDNNANLVYIIDFGLAKQYCNPNTHTHIPFTSGKSLTGTARYASVNALRGVEQSRRDDLESLGYVLVYLLKDRLPWMGLPLGNSHPKYAPILRVKEATSAESLCDGLPDEFLEYFRLVKNLSFSQKPNYKQYRRLFRQCFERYGFTYDYKYEWTTPQKRTRKLSMPRLPSPKQMPLALQQKNEAINHLRLIRSNSGTNLSRSGQLDSVHVNAMSSKFETCLGSGEEDASESFDLDFDTSYTYETYEYSYTYETDTSS
ncbi:CK1 family protein kinase [Histomonas meleagridis]|uniref:CK1 family protein kinase n=1 Tax=Histomonas meleagridis TaxID=135588 RepID=UPI00355A5588|nr:CK1 family protein kinase [Histomonas meleagridis]KAH0799950.1 CK1 family protein kinase [Histomonas meleagridis]